MSTATRPSGISLEPAEDGRLIAVLTGMRISHEQALVLEQTGRAGEKWTRVVDPSESSSICQEFGVPLDTPVYRVAFGEGLNLIEVILHGTEGIAPDHGFALSSGALQDFRSSPSALDEAVLSPN